MFKKSVLISAILFCLPLISEGGQMGGLSGSIGGQLLTVSSYVGMVDRDIKHGSTKNDFTSRMFGVKANYGLNDKVDIYGTIGFADIQDLGGFDGSLGTMYGIGGKFLAFEGPSSPARVTICGDLRFSSSSDGGVDADLRETSLAAIVSSKSGNLTPFAGLKYSVVEISFSNNWPDFEAEDNLGLFAGVDYFVNPNVYFNGELHVFAENSLYLGVGYNF